MYQIKKTFVYIVLAFKAFEYAFKSTHIEITKQLMKVPDNDHNHVFSLKDTQTFTFNTDICIIYNGIYKEP